MALLCLQNKRACSPNHHFEWLSPYSSDAGVVFVNIAVHSPGEWQFMLAPQVIRGEGMGGGHQPAKYIKGASPVEVIDNNER